MGRARPYSLVLIGARKAEARTKYLAFLAGAADRPSRIGTGGARPASVEFGIEPFARSLPTAILAKVSGSVDAATAFSGAISITGRVKIPNGATRTGYTAATAGTDFIKIADFSSARIIRKVYTTGTATAKKSEITGLTYGYRRSTSLSMPIGRKDANDTLADALSAAKSGLVGANALTQVFLKDEEF